MVTPARRAYPWIAGTAILILVPFFGIVRTAGAQSAHRIGIGGQVGAPGGFSVRYGPIPPRYADASSVEDTAESSIQRRDKTTAVTGSLSLTASDAALVQAHVVREYPIPESFLDVLVGPGIVTAIEPGGYHAGISAMLGLRFFRERFEIVMALAPRFIFLRKSDAELGASVGFRYYF